MGYVERQNQLGIINQNDQGRWGPSKSRMIDGFRGGQVTPSRPSRRDCRSVTWTQKSRQEP